MTVIKKGKETSHFKMFLHGQLTPSFAFQTNKIENHRHFSYKNETYDTKDYKQLKNEKKNYKQNGITIKDLYMYTAECKRVII